MTALFFIVWIVLCFVVANYADKKGRSYAVFFFCSLIFSPLIGFLLAVASGTDQKKLEEKMLTSKEYKKCAACAELVRADAKICKHCGRSEFLVNF
jgi:hypothetical protein